MPRAELAKYPTCLSDAQWRIIRRLLPAPSGRGRPQTVCRRHVLKAIVYAARSGCVWRLLPREFPKWKTVYGLFLRWRNDGTWQRIDDVLREKVRRSAGKKPTPTAAVIDSQSVKTTDVGGERGYDGGKKIIGRKRHLVVDTLGLILAVVVHGADWQDHDGACLVLMRLRDRFRRLNGIFADSAYGRNGLPEWVKTTFGKGVAVPPKRWIVERIFGWLGRYRRHSKDYERNPAPSEAMIYISMIHLMARRLAQAKI